MLKQACTILLMAATASAQIPVPAFSPSQSGSKSVQRIAIYRTYWHLRRGTAEEVLIVVEAGGPSKGRTQLFAFGGPFDWRLDGHRYPLSNGPQDPDDCRRPSPHDRDAGRRLPHPV